MKTVDLTDPALLEFTSAVEKARLEFGGERCDWHPSQWLDELLSTARQQGDWTCVTDSITAQLQQMEAWRNQLQEFLNATAAIIEKREQREQYTEAWWRRKRKLVDAAFQASTEQGLAKLLAVYAEALNAWALDICSEIVSESYPVEATHRTLEMLRTGTDAIRSENYPQALGLLTTLIVAANELDVQTRANMAIFAGRIYLRQDQRTFALHAFQYAKQLAPDLSKPYAALADHYRLSGDRDIAEQFCRDALERFAGEPDAWIEKGLLAEDKEGWDEADEYYEKAIETARGQSHPIAALSKMLAPLTGNFYLQLARTLKTENPREALEAVNRAISAGVKLEGNYPERVAYRIKADILDALGNKFEAAEAYFQAGSRFVYRNENQVAVDLLERARQLNPEHPLTDWYLADALYVTSWVPDYPYVQEAPLRRGAQIWDERISRELPAADYAWVYMTRAGLCDQESKLPDADRNALWWEAAAYLERSVLLSPSAAAYARIGEMHRYLGNEANALEATRKAVELDGTNLNALGERAAILANVGQFDEAEAIVEQRRKLAPNEWVDAVKAYVLTRQGQLEQALALINSVVEKAPTEIWYRDLRALCLRKLERREEARNDHRWIWNHYDPNDAVSATYFGSAAYDTGNLDEATAIFEKLLDDPSQDQVSVSWSLATVYFAKANFPRAEASLEKCISATINQRQLNDLVRTGLVFLREDSKEWPHAQQVEEALARFERRIDERRQVLGQPRAAIDEMKAALDQFRPSKGRMTWQEIAAYGAIGRLYQSQSRWQDAVAAYERLESESARFPEARIALQKLKTEATLTHEAGETSAIRK